MVLQTELRPQDMPDKGLVAELHFQAKAPEIWLGLIQGPGHNSAIMGWLILIPEPKYPWQLGIVPLSVWQVSALSYRAQGQSAYYMTVSFSLPLVSKWASSKAFPLSLLAVLGSPHSQRSHFFTGQWIHLRHPVLLHGASGVGMSAASPGWVQTQWTVNFQQRFQWAKVIN